MPAAKPTAHTTPLRRGAVPAILAAYVALLAAVAFGLVPGNWGLNSIRFVSPAARWIAVLLALAGLALVGSGSSSADRRGPPAAGSRGAPRGAPRGSKRSFSGAAAALALAIAATALLWALRDRTHFLGDGLIWIDNFRSGKFPHYSEPLTALVWQLHVALLRLLRIPPTADSLAVLPIGCGLAAGALLWAVTGEIVRGGRARRAAFAVLATLGSAMLYFGYIEAYAIVSVAILAYLLLALRTARGAGSAIGLAGAFTAALASHLVCVYLAPSYLYVIGKDRGPVWKRLALGAAPFVAGALAFGFLGVSIADLARPFGVLGVALLSARGASTTPIASLLAALGDLASTLLLVLPVPLVLVVARVFSGDGRSRGDADGPGRWLLPLAAGAGLLTAVALVIPGSPAQDWDLMSLTVLPLALLAVREGAGFLARSPGRIGSGLVLVSAASLLPFVLVNTSEPAAVARLSVIVGAKSRLSTHERAYGNEKLARTFMDRREFAAALPFARAAYEAESTNVRYVTRLGGVLGGLGRLDEAAPLLTKAIAMAPDKWDAAYDLGLFYVKARRYAEAAPLLERAVQAGAVRPEIYHLWGYALFHAGERDSAGAVWDRLVNLWPEYAAKVRGGAPPTETAVP